MNRPNKRNRNEEMKIFGKKNAEVDKQMKKELSIVAEKGTGSFYGKLNRKNRKIKKNIVPNAREFEQLRETLK